MRRAPVTVEELSAKLRAEQERSEELDTLRLAAERTWRSARRVEKPLPDDPSAASKGRARFRREIASAKMNDMRWSDDTAELLVTGLDPHFVVEFPAGLPAAYYEIVCRFDETDTVAAARVYMDYGRSISEANSELVPAIAGSKGRVTFAVRSVQVAHRVRIDPEVAVGHTFRLETLAIREVTRKAWYGRYVLDELREGIRRPWRLVRLGFYALKLLRSVGVSGLAGRLRDRRQQDPSQLLGEDQSGAKSYAYWIFLHEAGEPEDLAKQRTAAAALATRPLISVVMPVYDTPEAHLRAAIDSILSQTYDRLELCIADDASTAPHVAEILTSYAARDPRIKLAMRKENGHIAAASNSAFALATGEFVAMMDHDDVLPPQALFHIAEAIDARPDAELLYSDEDKIDDAGERFDPFFKPEFSLELLRSQNYFNHLTVHRAANIRSVGGWRTGFDGSQDYDLNLRIAERIDPKTIVHVPKVLYHWRAAEGSTALSGDEKSYAFAAGLKALQEHADRVGIGAEATAAPDVAHYRLRLDLPEPQPLVSIVIPTRDGVALLRDCIESIVSKTTYKSYEILVVDNGSSEPETLAYLGALEAAGTARIIPYDFPFNYSALNNHAVAEAKGSVVVLLNNDIVVISPDWLGEMVSFAVQPGVGCVGAKLYYEDGRIQHAGVIVGLGGVAGHSHKYFERADPGYFCRLKVVQNLSAVTAACLAVRKSVFQEVGGLNATDLKIAFNDVDFCLRVREAGYRNVWTPYAELYHLESVSRGYEDNPEKVARFNGEVAYMKLSWGDSLLSDPFYSPNLTLDRENFGLNLTRRLS